MTELYQKCGGHVGRKKFKYCIHKRILCSDFHAIVFLSCYVPFFNENGWAGKHFSIQDKNKYKQMIIAEKFMQHQT